MPNKLLCAGNPPRRVALFRALQLGDLLCAVPALRALRTAWPSSEIILLGLPWAENFVRRFSHYLDGFLAFPGYPGLPEQDARIAHLPAFLSAMQRMKFDVVVQMHGSGTLTNPLVQLMGARRTAGFFRPGEYCPDDRTFLPYPTGTPEIQALLQLMESLGVPPQGEALEFPLTNDDQQDFAALPEARMLQGGNGYVCIHPGARLRSRRWWPERFATVADALAAQGLSIVLTGSTEELPLARAVSEAMSAPAVNVAGRTSLGALGVLLRHARLLICNDTGVSHVAAALQTPSVVIACGSDPARWAPLDHTRHVVLSSPVACRPCAYDTCPVGHPCASTVTAEAVITAAQEVLTRYCQPLAPVIPLSPLAIPQPVRERNMT